ncbi:Spermidine synthase long [hydrothermal vent metagenome]|uniref:Spermidine synthase long n=1 Tax=hydrothermal vent metagenome TaxID=652676 RepID=A0A3B1B2V4_9ZZZZ
MPAPYRLAIYCLFALSGLVALVYEGVWARYLKLFLGHSSYGQILTLCIFMGGMGIGALLAARYSKSVKNPFLAYALIELLIGVGGFFYHDLYVLSTQLFYNTAIGISPLIAESLKITISVLITGPIAILLGTTFPLMGVALMRISRDGGQRAFPLLYFSNSIGAAIGILLASYYFIPLLGTAGSLQLAAAGNAVIALGLYVIGNRLSSTLEQTGESFAEVERPPLLQHQWNEGKTFNISVTLFLWLSLFTGLASFIYEIGWIRLLSLLLGASTHSFDIMVSAFVLGLACGGLFAGYLLRKTVHVISILAVAQILMGIFALCSIYFYEPIFRIMQHSREFLDKTEEGYVMFSLLKYGLSLLLMFPATFVAGMTLPIMTFFLTNVTRNEKYVGAIYGFNTIGSIIGATVAGLFLLPLLQLKMTIASGAFIDMAIGLLLLGLYHTNRRPLIAATGVTLLAITPLLFISFNPNLIASGYFRRTAFVVPGEKVTVRDGKTATISLHEVGNIKLIKTNGKTDASVGGTKGEETQAALAFLPMSMIDQPYTAAVIGMGSGMTAHYMLGDPLLQQLDLIEIEEEVYRLARAMQPHNRRVYEDPRLKLIFDDARTYFSTTGKQYDIIVSEPSNPWVSGVSSLFSQEFYQHTKRFLKPDGLLVQWMHLPEFNSDLMLSIIKALNTAFSQVKVYHSPYKENDVLLVASQQDFNADKFARFGDSKTISQDFQQQRKPTSYFSNRNYIAGIDTLRLLSDASPANSDYVPIIDSGAERAFYLRQHVDLFNPLANSIVFYQELLEPDSYPQMLQDRYDYYRSYRPNQQLMEQLSRQLKAADTDSDWQRLEAMLYQLMPPLLLRDLWQRLEVVAQFRTHVETGTPPEKTRLFFRFFDNVAQNRFSDNGPIISGMLQLFRGQQLDPTIVRALVINAVMLEDRELYDKVLQTFVTPNSSISEIDRRFMRAIQQQLLPDLNRK